MANLIRAPASTIQRRVAGKGFSATIAAYSRAKSIAHHANTDRSTPSEDMFPPIETLGTSEDYVLPDTPNPKLPSLPAKRVARPAVEPPPTLVLPPSMQPPPPGVLLPKPKARSRPDQKPPGVAEKTYDIYLKSLNVGDTEPTLEDLDALRPPASSLLAAYEGVIGSGRTLLPEQHALHLDAEQLGAQEATVGGGPGAKRKVVAGSPKAKKIEYAALYEATERLIAGGFNLPQLRRLEKMSRLERGVTKKIPADKSSSKAKIIHRIMESRWKMLHPLVIKEILLAENETLDQSYPVTPTELFIFLGKDGENLLNIAKEFGMKITVDRTPPQDPGKSEDSSSSNKPSTQPRFIIRATGPAGYQKKLNQHLEELRSSMAVRMVSLATGPPLSPAVLHNISRISGAFVENAQIDLEDLGGTERPGATVLITARNPRSAYTAERLVQRAAMEDSYQSQIQLFSLTQSNETPSSRPEATELPNVADANGGYALYPFSTHGFRFRRIQRSDELIQSGFARDADEEIILTDREPPTGNGEAITRDLKGNPVDLRELVFRSTREPVNSQSQKIIVTYGHIVFKTPNSPGLVSPLPDPVAHDAILRWVDERGTNSRRFIPGQVPLNAGPDSGKIQTIHRLQYRTVKGDHIVNVDVELPTDEPDPSLVEDLSEGEAGRSASSDRLELTEDGYVQIREELAEDIDKHPHGSYALGDAAASGSTMSQHTESSPAVSEDGHVADSTGNFGSAKAADQPDQESTPLPTQITVGTETALELMLPDNTLDMHLQLSDVTPLPESETPENLTVYLKELSKFFTTDLDLAQPDPPQYLSVAGREYMLVKNTSSRHAKVLFDKDMPHGCTISTENSLDLENNSRTTFTQLAYEGDGTPEGQDKFIHTCLQLAAKSYDQSSKLRSNPT